jgi:hypothetical protein
MLIDYLVYVYFLALALLTSLITLLLLFQFQTTAPKSCYMRPPGGILAPGESVIATGNIFFKLCFVNFIHQLSCEFFFFSAIY